MRLSAAMLAGLWVLLGTPAVAQKSFPYKAYVTGKDVYVRSGPGEQYYPTEKLQPGAEVEVYRHDPGGWYAIRPLPESFTWVSGRYLKPGKDGLAEVAADRVAARVGSQFSDIRDVVQVRLERGEVVELKGTKQVGAGDSAVMWYKISPPAGEFRWVYGKYVDPDFPRDGVRKAAAEESPLLRRPRSPVQAASATTPDAKTPAQSAIERPSAGRGRTSAAADAVAPAVSKATAAPLEPSGATSPQLPAGSMRHLSPEEFQAELDDINAELSIMLAEEPTVWDCGQMSRRAEALLGQAETAVERGRARVLVNRIAQADDVQRRFEEVNTMKSDTERRNRQLADVSRLRSEARLARRTDERFDGTGRLARVVPSKVGAPRYALLDDKGNVTSYVSPAPGVNMQYYLGRQVGVSGQRGYIADGNAKHITAKHVTAMDSVLR
jgi:hypothetical protein